jgi:nucleoside diphosphate-linked moiety X motif protein 19
VLAAGWTRAGTAAAPSSPPPPAKDFRLLMLKRAASQGFMPGAYVFPGGVVDAADRSDDWLRLFAPRQGPPHFGLKPAPRPRAAFPDVAPAPDAGALPDDVARRICAVREAFEEAGVLLLRPRSAPEPAGPTRQLTCAFQPPSGLAAWRARVRSDPREFLQLCAHLDCTPNIWALHDWSGWVTPFARSSPGRRFDTTFYLCCLCQPPPVDPDNAEVVDSQWLSPSEATESFISKKIWLPPPQFYEVRRLENFASLSTLHKFCLDHASEISERWLPITLVTADSMLQLLPGDELYVEDPYYIENHLCTEKKTEEIMKEGKRFHRLVIHNSHLYSVHVTIQSKYKHIYPKSYTVSKSHL